MSERKEELRLFVVGESSGDPNEWRWLGTLRLILARSQEEAIELAGGPYFNSEAAEVQAKEPTVLFTYENQGDET